MPRISIPIKKEYPTASLIEMAETLGRLTQTVVECQVMLEVTAAEPVLKALKELVPMAKAKRGKYRKTGSDLNDQGTDTPGPELDAGEEKENL
jgi:hypothetical protein